MFRDHIHVAWKHVACRRCRDNQVAICLFQQDWQERLGHMDGSPEIHAQDPLPVLCARLPYWPIAVALDSRVAADEVHSAEMGEGFLCESLNGLRRGHIGDYSMNSGA